MGVNRGGPISWPLHTRHRTFPYTGRFESVLYTPGERASYSAALIAQAELDVAEFYD